MKYILILLITISFAQVPSITHAFAQEQDWDLQRGYDPRNDERPVAYTEAQVIAPIGMGEKTEVEESVDRVLEAIITGLQETKISKALNLYEQVPFTARTSTIGFMLSYAEECYNDSIIVQEYIPCEMYGIGCLVDHGTKDAWFHPTPTFEGFIEWLKEKKQ